MPGVLSCVAVAEWERDYAAQFNETKWSLTVNNGSSLQLSKSVHQVTVLEGFKKADSIEFTIDDINHFAHPSIEFQKDECSEENMVGVHTYSMGTLVIIQ